MENMENNTIPAVQTPYNKTTVPLHESVLAWIFLALGFFFTHFTFKYAGGIYGSIFRLIFAAACFVYLKIRQIKTAGAKLLVFAVAGIFSLVPLFCANLFINVLSAIFSFSLYLYLLFAVNGRELFGKYFVSDFFTSVFARPFLSFSKQPVCAVSIFRGGKRLYNMLLALLGLTLALPLTFAVGVLLMSSDDIFESSVISVMQAFPEISPELVPEIIFAVPVSMYLFGALISSIRPAPAAAEKIPQYRFIPPVAGYAAVTPVCFFYMFYIGIQISRIFGGEKLMNASSYSQFARRGFFELCVIAVINLLVIIFMQAFLKRPENDRRPLLLKGFTVMICLSTLAIIATALTKMAMYISELGMTPLRVYTSWFMLLLGIVFIIIILGQFIEIKLWKIIFAAFTVMFGLLCFGNVDGFIANYNINAYKTGAIEYLDISALEELGFSAVAPTVQLYEEGYESSSMRSYIKNARKTDDYYDKTAYFSIPRAKAQEALKRISDPPSDKTA